MTWKHEQIRERLATALFLISGAIVHTGIMWKLPGRSITLHLMRGLTSFCVWSIALVVLSVAAAPELVEDIFDIIFIDEWVLFSAMVVIVLCGIIGTVLVPIVSISTVRKQHKSDWLRQDTALELSCPRCGHRQKSRQGYSRCANCNAAIFIELEEPRCECGYLLFELRSDTCPECGRAVNTPTPMNVTTDSPADSPTPPPVVEDDS